MNDQELLKALFERTGELIKVLFDKYDSPLTDSMFVLAEKENRHIIDALALDSEHAREAKDVKEGACRELLLAVGKSLRLMICDLQDQALNLRENPEPGVFQAISDEERAELKER